MYIGFLLLITLFIPTSQTTLPSLRLSFSIEENYFHENAQVDINCELFDPTSSEESAQLTHIDFKTGKRTPISRQLINNPTDDVPDVFKHNQNKRIDVLRKNYLRISRLMLEDSARYECSCPDCQESIPPQTRDLLVMKIAEPRWQIEPDGPLHENVSTTFRCLIDDFFPYLGHHIYRNHHEQTTDGQATLPTTNAYPQSFSWEVTWVPSADWHHVPLRCTITQGNTEKHAIKQLEVIFAPRFLKCDERQHVDSSKELATIECSFSGYPEPQIQWVRQSDGQPINDIDGIQINTTDEHHGKYRSVVTFERDKLSAIPLITTTRASSIGPETVTTTTTSTINGDNYYQQLLHGGFAAKLILDNEEKGIQKINIVSDAKQARANPTESTSAGSLELRSTSILLFFLTTFLYLIQQP